MSNIDVAVYIDVANLSYNGGYGMRFDVLRDFACRGGANPVHLNAYVGYDSERAQRDKAYRDGQQRFYSLLRDFGYKVIEKIVKRYTDETGATFGKANVDLDMGVDALTQSDRMNRVLLATGDGDFVQVIRALQNKGCRIEIVAFENISNDLKKEADLFISGFLIPNLLPTVTNTATNTWGAVGSRVRGTCMYFDDEKNFGFMRYLEQISADLFKTDPRQEGSPYKSAFFHGSRLPRDFETYNIPSRNLVFEFDLVTAEGKDGLQATNIQLASGNKKSFLPQSTQFIKPPQSLASQLGAAPPQTTA